MIVSSMIGRPLPRRLLLVCCFLTAFAAAASDSKSVTSLPFHLETWVRGGGRGQRLPATVRPRPRQPGSAPPPLRPSRQPPRQLFSPGSVLFLLLRLLFLLVDIIAGDWSPQEGGGVSANQWRVGFNLMKPTPWIRPWRECRGPVVSCSDILALAARDSVVLSGGPNYKVPLGRRDSPKFATQTDVLSGLPAPTANVPTLLGVLSKINLDANDLVALSGGHTVGLAHCTSFDNRLFPRQDPTMSASFASHLKQTCPAKGTDRRTVNDIRTPNTFDNKYYVNLLHREGLFTSDQDLFANAATKPIVTKFAQSQSAFFDQFAASMVKMGQIRVLTGSQGQIRRNCSARNPGTVNDDDLPSSVVDSAVEAAESLAF